MQEDMVARWENSQEFVTDFVAAGFYLLTSRTKAEDEHFQRLCGRVTQVHGAGVGTAEEQEERDETEGLGELLRQVSFFKKGGFRLEDASGKEVSFPLRLVRNYPYATKL